MALAATGRSAAALRMIEGMRAFARGIGTIERLAGRVALSLCEAVLAHRQGRHAEALKLMRPILGDMFLLGGSHAQQDVLEQFFLIGAQGPQFGERAADPGARVGPPSGAASGRIGYAAAAARATNALAHERLRCIKNEICGR